MQSPRRADTPEPASMQGRRNAGEHLLDEEGEISTRLRACLEHIFAKYCTPAVKGVSGQLLRPPPGAYLSPEGLDEWARETNGVAFSKETKEELIEFLDVTEEGGLTLRGFLQIYQLQTENDEEETWRDLCTHGFERTLELVTTRREAGVGVLGGVWRGWHIPSWRGWRVLRIYRVGVAGVYCAHTELAWLACIAHIVDLAGAYSLQTPARPLFGPSSRPRIVWPRPPRASPRSSMKAFLSRLHIGSASKDSPSKEKFPPLRPWPPTDSPKSSPAPSAPPALPVFKPLPEIVSQLAPRPSPPSDPPTFADAPDPPVDPPPPIVRKATNTSAASSEGPKKVAFKPSPDPPSPLPDPSPASVATATTATAADVVLSPKSVSKPSSTRATSPYFFKSHDAASAQSFRSVTPYSHMSAQTSGSRILSAQSWSEVTEEDLVSNLGSRERTRQEVLFEIISSEERYVQELTKMKETFIDPLLHPFSAHIKTPPAVEYDTIRSESPVESFDLLPPIAARFMSPTPTPRPKDTSAIDGAESMESEDDEVDDRLGKPYAGKRSDACLSPYRAAASRGPTAVPFPSRSHHSLPHSTRLNPKSASTSSLGRQSTIVEKDRDRERKYSQGHSDNPPPKSSMLRKFKKSQTAPGDVFGGTIPPHQLPEDFRICLEVIDGGVLDGHKKLCEALRKRYEDQFPLVRSLADVFVVHADIFRGYATYVLHLERALEQVDSALANQTTKKPSKQDAGEWQKVCSALRKLEEVAYERGETGLAITLSKPFQRLLKYPLLFQNLLFHTDPSTFEYETTLQMVAEIEAIVRSIEDEKIQKEERDKTRDVFARIDGLDKVRQLALPKPSRVLVEERLYNTVPNPANGFQKPSSPPPVINGKGVKGKSSLKRLSDVLSSGANGIGGKKDLWHVVFNDVILLCQRTGTTSLPLVASTTSRTNSLPELQGKAKYATTGRRNSHTKPRNLYKFIKIETWAIGDVVQPKEGVVSMDEVARSRAQALSSQPRIVPMPDDDEDKDNDSDDSDKKSKMSFSYWGADKMTVVQRPILKTRMGANPRKGLALASYQRVSSANAKFGTRLMSDSTSPIARPVSRRTTAGSPSIRRPPPSSEEGPNYARSTANRPAWDQGSRSTAPPSIKSRTRNTSQTSAATRATMTTANVKGLASPAPSNDSGVELYGQIMANDPDLTKA
ncbi:hypothetical protein APHAL10511_001244 [Amanita phalloides]|nr:hypothetical protein APHAL10511_001244 [Amanita phalloides]